ncbi:MAG: hypothetical protein EBR34_14035 [Sphingomonadaceae bacterium]|nr:hypothetical protein [Sphingomonadaceae bacterium]
MFNSSDRIIDRLDPREWGREEPHWIRTAVSTITMAAAVGAAGLAVWRYLQDNPQLFSRDEDAADEDSAAADYDGPTAPDVPPPTAN